MKASIRLFKAVPVSDSRLASAVSKEIMTATVRQGFIFSPVVAGNYTEKELLKLVDVVSREVGLSGDKMNASFHKSWSKVRDASLEQLFLEQVVHYITTYGFEAMGVYSQDSVYIPAEKLTIPKVKLDKVSLTVIKGYTKAELKEKLTTFLGSGIALSDDTKVDVIDLITFIGFSQAEIFAVKNKEVRVALYDLTNVLPSDPTEFLRYLVYKSTNTTMLIKDRMTIADIKTKDNLAVYGLLKRYKDSYGLEKLAEIFYRFKPLFLAFRTKPGLKIIINKIRKLAVKNHKPMPEDYLNSVTAKIKSGTGLNTKVMDAELSKANIFRKIRLAYALKYRTTDAESILYKVRNGKSFATKFDFQEQDVADAALSKVVDSIANDIKPQVDGKKIYLPTGVQYSLPTTEKQFTGDLPSGTSVFVPKDIIVGVHWGNVGKNRVDLDLSLIRCDGDKMGWDGYYRSGDSDVLFSGDVTDAPGPNGASELFYVKNQKQASYIVMLNYFNCDGGWGETESGLEVPFTIIVASEKTKSMERNHVVNPNNVVCTAKSKIKDKQKMLGLLVTSPEGNKFYFAEGYIGKSITAYGADYVQDARKSMLHFYSNMISLKDVLVKAGAVIVTTPGVSLEDGKQVKNGHCDIDLSYENIAKDSIVKILVK